MTENSNYIITAVRYNGTKIDIFNRRREDNGGLSDSIKVPQQAVAQDIKFDVSYCTAIRDESGDWVRGDDVETFELDGELFIRAEEGKNPAGDFGELSDF